MLVVIEGLDGSGKATQAACLCEALERQGTPYRKVSFPAYDQPSSSLVKLYLDGAFGSRPEDVSPYAASSFYAVDRFASYRRFWQEDYKQGKLIVADRYVTSNLVYQLTKLPRDQWESFTRWLEDYEYEKLGLPRPDLTLYLDMPPKVSQCLLDARYQGDPQKKDLHERDVLFLEACRETALFSADALGWKVVSCAQGNVPKDMEQIQTEIWKSVTGLIIQNKWKKEERMKGI
ncbi:MAG: thymidylate kinase [Clostridiales bacterium]|jgi:dTMP kinase|nr:thymidylate kinase [Clostridiales bacterium]